MAKYDWKQLEKEYILSDYKSVSAFLKDKGIKRNGSVQQAVKGWNEKRAKKQFDKCSKTIEKVIEKEAEKEAQEIVKEAENRIISMIDEHEITKKAYEQKNKIIENANDMAREISNGTKAYADSILAGVQVTLEDALKVIQNNRKEVK